MKVLEFSFLQFLILKFVRVVKFWNYYDEWVSVFTLPQRNRHTNAYRVEALQVIEGEKNLNVEEEVVIQDQ